MHIRFQCCCKTHRAAPLLFSFSKASTIKMSKACACEWGKENTRRHVPHNMEKIMPLLLSPFLFVILVYVIYLNAFAAVPLVFSLSGFLATNKSDEHKRALSSSFTPVDSIQAIPVKWFCFWMNQVTEWVRFLKHVSSVPQHLRGLDMSNVWPNCHTHTHTHARRTFCERDLLDLRTFALLHTKHHMFWERMYVPPSSSSVFLDIWWCWGC